MRTKAEYRLLKLTSRFTASEIVSQALTRFHCATIAKEFKGRAEDFLKDNLTAGFYAEYVLMDDASKRHIRRHFAEQILQFAQDLPYTIRGMKVSKSGMLIYLWIQPK